MDQISKYIQTLVEFGVTDSVWVLKKESMVGLKSKMEKYLKNKDVFEAKYTGFNGEDFFIINMHGVSIVVSEQLNKK